MIQFLRNLVTPPTPVTDVIENPIPLGLRFETHLKDSEAQMTELRRLQAVEDDNVRAAATFLQDQFQKLGEEQAKGLADAGIGNFNADNVSAFEEKLRLANRLILAQADTCFGGQIVDRALVRLGHIPSTFRRNNR